MKQNKTRASRKSNVTSCMKNPYPILLLLPLLFLLSGCNAIAIWLYGLDTKFVPAHDDNREKIQARFGLEGEPWYELDETSLTCYLMDSFYTKLDTTDSLRWERLAKHLNNHLQMLQAMYFDRAGRLVSYHLNCYAEGFPNLKWNKYGAFNSFPPSSAAPPDTLLPLPALLPHIRDTHDNPISATPSPQADYTVVVFWSGFFGRQSKRLIRTVQRNLPLAADSLRVEALFVNDDWFLVKMDSIVQMKQKQYAPQGQQTPDNTDV